jgi:glutaminase
MINSGAIMVISMIEPDKKQYERYDNIRKFLQELSGNIGVFNFDNGVYLSEREHADINRALAYIMNGYNAFPKGTTLEATLDLYFQACSITTNTETAAIISSTIANNGVCPINGERVIMPELIQNCLTLMIIVVNVLSKLVFQPSLVYQVLL